MSMLQPLPHTIFFNFVSDQAITQLIPYNGGSKIWAHRALCPTREAKDQGPVRIRILLMIRMSALAMGHV